MAAGAEQPPPPAAAGRPWVAEALHRLPPLDGAPLLVAHCFLAAAASPAELDAAARLHEAQAAQLRNAERVGALARAYRTLEPIRVAGSPRLVRLAELLALAPPDVAAAVEGELCAAGLDPAGTLPPPPWPP
jgi:hypothetical protein